MWTCLGSPPDRLFAIPEFSEPDRRNVHAGTIGVHVSAPRAVENFLDMGHFPFVHTDVLGAEPHTEVVEYDVHIDPPTPTTCGQPKCVFYQPRAATTSTEGQMSDYLYRVPHPFCVILYKTTPLDKDRMDVIALFCRPNCAGPNRGTHVLRPCSTRITPTRPSASSSRQFSAKTNQSSRTSTPSCYRWTRGQRRPSEPTRSPSRTGVGCRTLVSPTA